MTSPLTPGRSSKPQPNVKRLTALALIFVGVALCFVLIKGSVKENQSAQAVNRYLDAWERGNYIQMYRLLSPDSKRNLSFERFQSTIQQSNQTATARSLSFTKVEDSPTNGFYSVNATVKTRVFGSLKLPFKLSVDDSSHTINYTSGLAFPALKKGESLTVVTELPERAALLALDGTAITKGPQRSLGLASASSIVGEVGPIPSDQIAAYKARGIPADATVGISGLEKIFQDQLAGEPGGKLLAGTRLIASHRAKAAKDVRTSIDPKLQTATVNAMSDRFGGAVVLDPHNGQVRAVAGLGFSGLQPPGSTFKIVTAAAGLEAKKVKVTDSFPFVTKTTLDGVELENANGESCGGSFVESFAESCNSVFAPLGAKVGSKALVEMAERFGFNQPPPFAVAAESSIPAADQIQGELATGSTAIGQGKVLASTLQVASLAQVIAASGIRYQPSLSAVSTAKPQQVIDKKIAHQIRQMMVAVVKFGTGTAAAIPGVTVAGKTGTAELKDKPKDPPPGEGQTTEEEPTEEEQLPDTDAWFTSFAPAKKPRLVVAVLVINGGTGGEIAAPIARQILVAGL